MTFIFCIFLTLSKIPIEVLDLINDSKIFPIYKNVMYNWKINPIKSIHLYNSTEHLASYINWKGYILELERLNDFNYINILLVLQNYVEKIISVIIYIFRKI